MSETQTQRRCSGGGKSILSREMQAVPVEDHRARRRTIQAKPQRLSRVVLPLPDGPTMAQVVPAARENEISLRTVSGPAPV